MKIRKNVFKITALFMLMFLLSACGSEDNSDSNNDIQPLTNTDAKSDKISDEASDDDSDDDQADSNPDFISKAAAISFNQISLYSGHVEATDRKLSELDTNNLQSGDLITVEVNFEVSADTNNYNLAAQLVPQSIFSLLDQGDTLGQITNANSDALQGNGVIELGGVYVDNIQPGLAKGIIHAKLPVLAEDTTYKVFVTPSIEFLSSGKPINADDATQVPVMIDERELAIRKLDEVLVNIINTPDLRLDNDFTQLEIGGKFDLSGFSIEPIFQTSVQIDISTFNSSETIGISLSYADPSGISRPLGLQSSDELGNPIISTKAKFLVENASGNSVTIPVVAYVPFETQRLLLKQATNITKIADSEVTTGNFDLHVFKTENGVELNAGVSRRLSLPLVSQNNKVQQKTADEATGFNVLRAGRTNSGCLAIFPDIDTGLIQTDSTSIIKVGSCVSPATTNMLWRYDAQARTFVSKLKDADNNNYCITAIDKPVVANGPSTSSITEVNVQKCTVPSRFSVPSTLSTQKFEIDGDKINSTKGFLQVISFGSRGPILRTTNDISEATEFFRNTDGVDVDQSGRLFHASAFEERSWGNENVAQVSLSYGGETYVDYMPVLGATAEGHANINASLLGVNATLAETSFALKRYFSKKISTSGNNSPSEVVANGAELKVDFAGFSALSLGGITQKTITENFLPSDDAGNVLSQLTGVTDIERDIFENKLNIEFVNQVIIVGIIPITVTGGVDGNLKILAKLNTPGFGYSVGVEEQFTLNGFLNAKLDAVVAAAGIEGELEVLNQRLLFAANGGFSSPSTTQLTFDVGSSFTASLKLLKGKLAAFAEYRKICLCSSIGKKIRKEKVIYSSDYLLNTGSVDIFDKNINATVIDY